MVAGGKLKGGLLPLVIDQTKFTSPSLYAHDRCTAQVTVSDEFGTNRSNSTAQLVIDAVDLNDF